MLTSFKKSKILSKWKACVSSSFKHWRKINFQWRERYFRAKGNRNNATRLEGRRSIGKYGFHKEGDIYAFCQGGRVCIKVEKVASRAARGGGLTIGGSDFHSRFSSPLLDEALQPLEIVSKLRIARYTLYISFSVLMVSMERFLRH